MLLFADDVFEAHETGSHPEHAGRLRAIRAQLAVSGVLQRCQLGMVREATTAELQLIHPAALVNFIEHTAATGGGRLDADTVCSSRSAEVARIAVGTACAAVDAVLSGHTTQVLGLVRPPGHHALRDRAMGFCLYNNIAVAAEYARTQHHLDRVLIVDWDVHHGNGTEAIFYDNENVTFLSIHRYPFYPGTGALNDTGCGSGLGYNFNVPVKFGTSIKDYFAQFSAALESAATACRPQLILLSAGFDAHRLDPVGSLGLESEDYIQLTRMVLKIAQTHCNGRIISLLEGGYNVQALAESVQLHVETMLAAEDAT